jgi:hypothetical protein
MNINKYTFYPPVKREIRINQFSIDILSMTLFDNVKIVVHLYDENGLLQDNKFYLLSGEEYKAWASDDNYIVQYVKAKLQEERNNDTAQNVVNVMKSKVSKKKSENNTNNNLVSDT